MKGGNALQTFSVDEILAMTGGFGRLQQITTAVCCAIMMVQTYPMLIMYFGALDPPWECQPNSTICNMNGTLLPTNQEKCKMNRKEWRYTEPIEYSVVTEFDLSCDDEWYAHMTSSALFIGMALGSILLGWLQDNFGRRIILFGSTGLLITFMFANAYANSIQLFIFFRFMSGFVVQSGGTFIMGTELVGHKFRPIVGNIIWFFWTTGLCLMALIAYYNRTWKDLFILCSVPYVFVLLTYRVVPESPRYLNVNGKKKEAMQVLRWIGKVNKREIGEDIYLDEEDPGTNENGNESKTATRHKTTPWMLFVSGRHLCVCTLIQCTAWFTQGLVYYGISYAAGDLGGDLYVNYVLGSVVEFPGYFIGVWSCNRLGRKTTVIGSMFLSSVSCILINFMPTDTGAWEVGKIALGTFGKLCSSVSFDGIYVWSVELFPTVLRGEGMGLMNVASQLGGALSPWVAKGLLKVHSMLPFIIMGSVGLLSTGSMVWLPETRGLATIETVRELELQFGTFDEEREKKWWRKKKRKNGSDNIMEEKNIEDE